MYKLDTCGHCEVEQLLTSDECMHMFGYMSSYRGGEIVRGS